MDTQNLLNRSSNLPLAVIDINFCIREGRQRWEKWWWKIENGKEKVKYKTERGLRIERTLRDTALQTTFFFSFRQPRVYCVCRWW